MGTDISPGARYLLDVNVLVALAVPEHVHHARARAWFGRGMTWASCTITEGGLVRLLTQRASMIEPASMATALAVLRAMRADTRHMFFADDASLAEAEIDLSRLASSRDVTDVHLVDLAARHGAVLATLDRGIPELLAEADRRHVIVIP